MIAGQYFVTPHAVRQFIARIAPHLTYDQALGAIIHGIEGTRSEPKPCHSGAAVYVRVRLPYAFRAVIAPGEGELPAVITILRSGNGRGGRRERERREHRNACGATGGGVD